MCYRNAAQLRAMLVANPERTLKEPPADGTPVRQNRRTGLIEAALTPARDRITDAQYERLCAALALVFGTEAMIVFSGVLGLDPQTARHVKSWAIRALVRAATREQT